MLRSISSGVAKSEIVVLPNDGNHYGNIFGGALLSLMDRTAYIAARKYAESDLVTVALDNVVFKNPVKVGDTAEISAKVSYVGKTSVEVRVGVVSEGKTAVQNAYFTYVNIDAKGSRFRLSSRRLRMPKRKRRLRRVRRRENNRGF